MQTVKARCLPDENDCHPKKPVIPIEARDLFFLEFKKINNRSLASLGMTRKKLPLKHNGIQT